MLSTLPCPGSGDRLVPSWGLLSPPLHCWGTLEVLPVPGALLCSSQRLTLLVLYWGGLEEELALQGRVEPGKGPRSGAHSQNADSFDN